MYTMREVCKETGMTYEGLKFYCNQGLVPNVKRDGIDPTEANGTYTTHQLKAPIGETRAAHATAEPAARLTSKCRNCKN